LITPAQRARLGWLRLRAVNPPNIQVHVVAYDREIAYTSDDMAVACTLALKFRHISMRLGRIAWLEQLIKIDATGRLFTDAD
jgi:hypothetical protein